MKISIACTEEEYENKDEIEEVFSDAMQKLVDLGFTGEIKVIVPNEETAQIKLLRKKRKNSGKNKG